MLWTYEYFEDIKNSMKDDGIITTYSIAFKTRLALHKLGFNIYLKKNEDVRDSTVATQKKLNIYEEVDMEHKISCNPNLLVSMDKDI